MAAYYNENDLKTAAWLRALIAQGLIADGEVDTRSIVDVQASDLVGFRQCHFFAGIGGWSYALRLARWDDARPVWTGSCPCQPFSSAGTKAGGNDPRDLWPAWYQLVKQCRPPVVFGEQVESAIGHGWLDRLCDDLEREDYAVGAVGLPAACVGAFHIRQRLWFVAESNGREQSQECAGDESRGEQPARRRAAQRAGIGTASGVGELADTEYTERRPLSLHREDERDGRDAGRTEAYGELGARREVCELADTSGTRHPRRGSKSVHRGRDRQGSVTSPDGRGALDGLGDASRGGQRIDRGAPRHAGHPDEPIASFWARVDWLPCRDGKARPVEPGTFPLAHGVPARVGRLRGYGNAIVPPLATEFIKAYLDCER